MSRPLFVILATVFLDAIGIGLIIPIVPDLLREIYQSVNVAHHYGYFISIYAFMQFIFSPVLGALSDRFGRKPVLLVSLAGAAIDYVIMAFAPNLIILYVSRAIAGITGANIAVATSYIADTTTKETRAKGFGLMNAAFGLGFVVGPVFGGVLGDLSLKYPFILAALLNGVNFALGYFVLPESLPKDQRRNISFSKLNPVRSLRWAWSLKTLLPLIGVFFILHLAGQVPHSLWAIYGQSKFGWDVKVIGLSFAFYGLLLAFSQGFLTGPITKYFGERRALNLGLMIEFTTYILFGLATNGWMMFAILIPHAMGGVAFPALQSLLSKQVPEREQGELQGTLVSVMSLATIAGPIVVTSAYSALPNQFSGGVWIIAALLYLLCIPIILRESKSLS